MSKSNNVYNVITGRVFTAIYGRNYNYCEGNSRLYCFTRITKTVILNLPEIRKNQLYMFSTLITLDYILYV